MGQVLEFPGETLADYYERVLAELAFGCRAGLVSVYGVEPAYDDLVTAVQDAANARLQDDERFARAWREHYLAEHARRAL